MKYTPSTCPKCGSGLVKSAAGGRPNRWCCEGCKRSGGAEMDRLLLRLRVFEEGRGVDIINGRGTAARDGFIADMQARYDHSAGVTSVTAAVE